MHDRPLPFLSTEAEIHQRCDSLFEGIAVFSERGELLWMNPCMERMIACRPGEIETFDRMTEIMFPDDPDPDSRKVRFLEAEGAVGEDAFLEFRTGKGSVKWCRVGITRPKDGTDICLHLLDCSEHRERDERFRWNERQFRAIFEESKDAISISGSVCLVNQAWLELFGYTREEMETLDLRTLYVNPDDRTRYLAELETRGYVTDYPVRLRRKDGVEIDCLYTATVQWENGGKSKYIQGFIRDITREKKAAEALRESEDQYRTLFEDSKDAIILYSHSRRRVNRAWVELTGFSEEEAQSLDFDRLYVDPEVRIQFFREMEEKGFARDFEVRIRRKDGRELYCLSTATVYRNNDGDERLFQCIIRDVTPMRLMLAALREREEQYRHLVENIREVIYSVDIHGVITYISPVIESVSGYRSEELVGCQLADIRFIYPSDVPVVHRAFRNVLDGESGVHEFRFLSKWGEVVCFSASVHPDRNGIEVTGFHGILVDITSTVQAEKVLQESQERMRAFLDSATEGFFLFDSYLNLAEINLTAQREFGLIKEDVLGKPLSILLKAIRFPVSTAVFVDVLKTGEPATLGGISFGPAFMDFKIFRMGHGIGIIAVNITEQKNAENDLQKARAELERRVTERTEDLSRLNRNLEQEVSERKRTQEALTRRERELNALLNNLADIAWFKDTESRFILANQALADWIGVAPEYLKGRSDFDLWPRELADRYVADDLRAMRTGETVRVEEPILDRNGRTVIIETIKSSLRDENGTTIGTVGISRDITERKKIEEALRQSEERLKLAMDSSEEGIWDWDIASGSIFWSPRIPLMLGYHPSEFSGVIDDIFLRIHPDDRLQSREKVRKHLRGETSSCMIEYRVQCRDNSWKWVQDKGRVVFRDETGAPVRMTGTHRDITERKKTEKILRESEERYRAIFENAGVALLELDLSAVKSRVENLKQKGDADVVERIHRHPNFCRELYDLIRVVDVNQKTLDIYEADSKEELSLAIDAHFSDELVPFMIRLMRAIALGEPGMQIEFEGTTLRRTKRYVMVNASIPSHDDRFNRVLISITDLTERKHFEDELRRTHEELEIRVRERTQVLACTNLELEREILDREATEKALRESEERYRTLFETSIDAIGVTGSDFRCINVNRAWLDLFGKSEGDAVTNDFGEVFVEPVEFSKVMSDVISRGELRDFEVKLRKSSGASMVCLLSMTAWKNGEGGNIGYQILIRDITERKKAERVLKNHVEFQQHISAISTNFINLPIEEIDIGINHALQVLCEYTGVDRGLVFEYHDGGETNSLVHEWCGEGIESRFGNHTGRTSTWTWTIGRLRRNEIVYVPSLDALSSEAGAERKDCGEFGTRSFIAVPMVHGGNLIGVLGLESVRAEKYWGEESFPLLKLVAEMLVNALDRRRAGREVLRYQEKLRSVASELTLAEERERRRIAVELHDRIGQTLALSKIKLGGIREKVVPLALETKIDEVSGLINEAISDTRSLIFEISPPVLYDLGLEAALEWLTDQVHQQHGIRAGFRVSGKEMSYGNNLRVLLFQFVRELLVNVVKHSRAQALEVIVHRLGSEVKIEVADDGIGFSYDVNGMRPTLESGFGHFSIRERLDHLGGRFHVESTPGKGTRVSLSVPIGDSV